MQFLFLLILIILYFFPIVITVFNIVNLLKNNPIKEKTIDILTFIFGIMFSLLLFNLWAPLEYTEAITLDGMSFQLHSPISYKHMSTILVLTVFSLSGYFVLRIKKNKLSPLLSIICISSLYIGILVSVIYLTQLSNNIFSGKGIAPFDVVLMIIFPINYILCSIRLIRQVIILHIKNQDTNNINYKNKFLRNCKNVLSKSIGWYLVSFILMIPLLGIFLIILVLFGQMPDAFIRAFTETSDWTLSQEISPPPIPYKGHYLCTVALNGHENIVKPTRVGIRQDVKIVVNRQLCVANAFEHLIEEKYPKFHEIIRDIYDKYGYPLSKHITSKLRADIVYLVMKPIEWLFIIVLYSVDINPENRIAIQYTGKRFID